MLPINHPTAETEISKETKKEKIKETAGEIEGDIPEEADHHHQARVDNTIESKTINIVQEAETDTPTEGELFCKRI